MGHSSSERGADLARTTLLYYLITCIGGTWLLEQPGGSLMDQYDRFRELCRRMKATLLDVYKSWAP